MAVPLPPWRGLAWLLEGRTCLRLVLESPLPSSQGGPEGHRVSAPLGCAQGCECVTCVCVCMEGWAWRGHWDPCLRVLIGRASEGWPRLLSHCWGPMGHSPACLSGGGLPSSPIALPLNQIHQRLLVLVHCSTSHPGSLSAAKPPD